MESWLSKGSKAIQESPQKVLLNSQVPCSTPFLCQSPAGEVRKSTQNFFLFHHPLSSRSQRNP